MWQAAPEREEPSEWNQGSTRFPPTHTPVFNATSPGRSGSIWRTSLRGERRMQQCAEQPRSCGTRWRSEASLPPSVHPSAASSSLLPQPHFELSPRRGSWLYSSRSSAIHLDFFLFDFYAQIRQTRERRHGRASLNLHFRGSLFSFFYDC